MGRRNERRRKRPSTQTLDNTDSAAFTRRNDDANGKPQLPVPASSCPVPSDASGTRRQRRVGNENERRDYRARSTNIRMDERIRRENIKANNVGNRVRSASGAATSTVGRIRYASCAGERTRSRSTFGGRRGRREERKGEGKSGRTRCSRARARDRGEP